MSRALDARVELQLAHPVVQNHGLSEGNLLKQVAGNVSSATRFIGFFGVSRALHAW